VEALSASRATVATVRFYQHMYIRAQVNNAAVLYVSYGTCRCFHCICSPFNFHAKNICANRVTINFEKAHDDDVRPMTNAPESCSNIALPVLLRSAQPTRNIKFCKGRKMNFPIIGALEEEIDDEEDWCWPLNKNCCPLTFRDYTLLLKATVERNRLSDQSSTSSRLSPSRD